MKILSIILKELKHNFRNKPIMAIMILFPIVLIFICGSISFEGKGKMNFKGEKVLYKIEEGNSSKAKSFGPGFNRLIKEFEKQGFNFIEAKDGDKAFEDVKNNKYICYVVASEKEKTIKIYKNDKVNFKGSIVQTMIQTFVDRSNLINEIIKVEPRAMSEKNNFMESADKETYVEVEALNKKKEVNSLNYYAVTMITLIAMYSILTGIFSIKSEETRKTQSRILISPVKKQELFLGKLFGVISVTFLQIGIVIGFSIVVYHVDWGSNFAMVLCVIASNIVLFNVIGIAMGIIIKGQVIAEGLTHMFIGITAFLGGSYFPVDNLGNKVMNFLSKFSILNLCNKGIFKVIYNNDNSMAIKSIIVSLVVAFTLLIISSLEFKKKEWV